MELVVGLLAALAAAFAFATALVPRWRGVMHWKGTRVRTGILSSLGFGMLFGGTAVLFFTHGVLADGFRAWFALLLLAGFICILVGQYFDFRQT
jgi:hypothetical protein